jgi:hypothetical protein
LQGFSEFNCLRWVGRSEIKVLRDGSDTMPTETADIDGYIMNNTMQSAQSAEIEQKLKPAD